jgi:hypothetical protein
MTPCSRRELLKHLAAASTAAVIPAPRARAQAASSTASPPLEIQITPVSVHTFRLSILPSRHGSTPAIPSDGSLVLESFGPPLVTLREETEQPVVVGNFKLTVALHPVSITIANQGGGVVVQQLGWDQSTGALSFASGNSPLFGLGEGGPQFDPARIDPSNAQRTGRLPASDPRRSRSCPLDHRNIGLGGLFSPALRHVRLQRSSK